MNQTHQIDAQGQYCSCGQDACTCQVCGARICGSAAEYVELPSLNGREYRGNVCVKHIIAGTSTLTRQADTILARLERKR